MYPNLRPVPNVVRCQLCNWCELTEADKTNKQIIDQSARKSSVRPTVQDTIEFAEKFSVHDTFQNNECLTLTALFLLEKCISTAPRPHASPSTSADRGLGNDYYIDDCP